MLLEWAAFVYFTRFYAGFLINSCYFLVYDETSTKVYREIENKHFNSVDLSNKLKVSGDKTLVRIWFLS